MRPGPAGKNTLCNRYELDFSICTRYYDYRVLSNAQKVRTAL